MSFNFDIVRRNAVLNNTAPSNLDPDAQIYIDALNNDTTVPPAHETVINDLFLDLKSNSFYSDLIAFYPTYGSNETLQRYNAKNPLNTDAAHRLTFTLGVTHTFNGFTIPAISGANAKTYINQLNHTTLNDFSGFVWSKTESQTNTVDIGVGNGSSSQFFGRRTGNLLLSDAYNATGASRVTATNPTSIGLMGYSLLPSPEKHSVYNNTGFLNSRADITGSRVNDNILIGNRGNLNGTGRTYGFAIFINRGITDAEFTTLQGIVSNYITNINL